MEDYVIARKYVNKANGAIKKNQEFSLTFCQFKILMKKKTCYYTGISLTEYDGAAPLPNTARTLDRFDNSIGYVDGNVFACCHAANYIKSIWEDPQNPLDSDLMKKMMNKL